MSLIVKDIYFKHMIIKTFYFNPYRECTYILHDEFGKAIVIDAGMYEEREQQQFANYIAQNNLHIVALLITHTHMDHICGLDFLQKKYNLTPIIQPTEGELALLDTNFKIEVITTPGHKEDAVCYYLPTEKILFTGDTLFQESIGRTDLPGGDMGILIRSLKKLITLPENTQVYPGHGYPTTISHEKLYNPYL